MSKHICGRCGCEFTSKAKCWYHMDFECPKQTALSTLQDLRCRKPRTKLPSDDEPNEEHKA